MSVVIEYNKTHLDGTRVDNTHARLEGGGDGKLGDDGLTGRRVRRHQNSLAALNTRGGDILERVELELVRPRRRVETLVLRDRNVREAGRDGDLLVSSKT